MSFVDPYRFGSSGGAPAWLGGAVEGINFIEQEAYFAGVLYTDLADVCGGRYDASNLSAGGYDAYADPNGTITATNAMLTKFAELEWACVIEFSTISAPNTGLANNLLAFSTDDGGGGSFSAGWKIDFAGTASMGVTDDSQGSPSLLGNRTVGQIQKLAFSTSSGGWISAFDGGAGVTNTPISAFNVDYAYLGGGDGNSFQWEGQLRSFLFYPETDELGVEALSS